MPDGRRIYVLADGRLVNLGAAEGHPALVMDMSFAEPGARPGVAARARWRSWSRGVYGIPDEIDREVARLKLRSMGIEIDALDAGAEGLQRVLGVRHLTHRLRAKNKGSPDALHSPLAYAAPVGLDRGARCPATGAAGGAQGGTGRPNRPPWWAHRGLVR